MRNSSPRQLALIVSLITSFVTALLVLLGSGIDNQFAVFLIPASLLISFIISYFLIYYSVHNFIFKKINPLYRAIETIPLTKKELSKKMEGKDPIKEVNSQVENYTRNRSSEIMKLRRLEKYRKEFLGNVSHELKTPIFNIQGYILTLLDGGLEDQRVNREYLERTEKSINRMISIVEDLESITKLETGELKLEKKDFDIVKLVKEVFELQDTNCKKYKIKLAFAKNYDKSIKVNGDRKRITEVLNNLIINSIFYGDPGGQTTVSFEMLGDNVQVNVSDDGIGIEKEEIPRIFERFYRTDKSRSRDRGGTGLGLAIVKHIIEAHNQAITVVSEPGSGTTFSFTLKRA